MDSDSVRKAGDILKSLLDENQNKEAQQYYRFFSAWDEILGERLAGRTRAVELKGKTLIVEVDHPGWIQLLDMRKAHIIHELGERFPGLEVEKIRYYVAGEPNTPQESDTSQQTGPDKGVSADTESEGKRDSSTSEDGVHPGGEESSKPASEETSDSPDSTDRENSKKRLDNVLKRLSDHIEGSDRS